MSAYHVSLGVKATLVDIYAYTHETWGKQQADKYLEGFFTQFEGVATKTVMWRPIPAEFEVQDYYARYEKHVIYWRQFEDSKIGIVAILHQNMLQGDCLKEAFRA